MNSVRHEGRSPKVPVLIAAVTVVVLALGFLLYHRAKGATNSVALASRPKPVTVVEATSASYRQTHRYVGTIEAWYAARVGPQFLSAYVDTVLVRPGAMVSRGQVIATLDCRTAATVDKSVAMQARALEHTQAALADQAARMSTLLQGGYAAPDEVEMRKAESESKQAQLLAMKAQMLGTSLQVKDCVLRAPFDGEVAERFVDPGAFVRPGNPISTILDRKVVRLTVEVPEADFDAVPPGTPVRIHLLANGRDLTGTISRRAPSADSNTRTVHIEIDLPNQDRSIPVGTTAEVRLDAGQAVPATEIPLAAASVRGKQATVVVVEGDVARKRTVRVRGERGGSLFIDPALKSGSLIVLEGRESVSEGDKVQAKRQQVAAGGELEHGSAVASGADAGLPASTVSKER